MLDNSFWQIPEPSFKALERYVYKGIPSTAWRTPEKIRDWIRSGGLEGKGVRI